MRKPEGFMSLLLFTLMEDEPQYGYELIKRIEEETRGYWEPGQGTVYGALERLAGEGMIEEVEIEEETGESNRQYYGLTEKGRERLDKLRDKCEEEIKPEERILGLMYIYRFLAGKKKFESLLEEIEEEFMTEDL